MRNRIAKVIIGTEVEVHVMATNLNKHKFLIVEKFL